MRALLQRRVDALQLQQAEGGVEFAHLAVDAGRHHGHFVDEAEILQVVDALLGLGVGADDGAALEGIEYLGRMEAQHRQVAVIEHAAAVALHAKGVGGVVDHLQAIVVGDPLDALRRRMAGRSSAPA